MVQMLRKFLRPVKNWALMIRERRTRTGVNLNVGSGHQEIAGFISLDLDSDWYRSRNRRFIEYNMITDNLPIEAGTVDNIYVSHVVEHLPDHTVSRFLSEAHRVLKPGGVLRIACPDAEFLWEVSSFPNTYWNWRHEWFRNTSLSRENDTGKITQSDYYVREVATPHCRVYANRRAEVPYSDDMFKHDYREETERVCKNLQFDERFPGDHINSWDFNKVKHFGAIAGFERVIRSKWRGSVSATMQHPDFDQTCPNMSLYVDLVR